MGCFPVVRRRNETIFGEANVRIGQMLLYLFLHRIRHLLGIIHMSVRRIETQSRDSNGRSLSGMAIKLAPNASLSFHFCWYSSFKEQCNICTTFSLYSARILYVAGMERL
jgi:hypothetical protein